MSNRACRDINTKEKQKKKKKKKERKKKRATRDRVAPVPEEKASNCSKPREIHAWNGSIHREGGDTIIRGDVIRNTGGTLSSL